MQRDDLISLLSRYDNDNVAIKINGMMIDVAVVTTERGNLVLAPRLHDADDYDDDSVSIEADDDTMSSQELLCVLATQRDADVKVAVGAIFIDVCGVTHNRRWERFVLRSHPDDLLYAARKLVHQAALEGRPEAD